MTLDGNNTDSIEMEEKFNDIGDEIEEAEIVQYQNYNYQEDLHEQI